MTAARRSWLGLFLGATLGCGSSDAVVDLPTVSVEALQSTDVKMRIRGARHFRDLKEIPAEVAPKLVQLLSDQDPGVRLAAAEALAEAGTSGKSLVPELLQRRKAETDKHVKAALEVAVERISNAGLPDPKLNKKEE